MLTGCACNAIQDSNAPWQPDVKLSGLAKLFESGKTRQIVVVLMAMLILIRYKKLLILLARIIKKE